MKKKLDMWPSSIIESVSEVLGDTNEGLTGTEIARLLAKLGVPDIDPMNNKRFRLSNALVMHQQKQQASNCVVGFIVEAMQPALHFKNPTRRQFLQDALSERLSLMGLRILDDGRVGTAPQATTLDEAARLAGRLQTELVRRGTHPEVVRFCEEELVRRSIFHAVFEATKGLAERLRQLSGAHGIDGSELVDHCFGAKSGPVVRINAYTTKTEVSEHNGFANLLRGIFGTFRNPPAHTPRATEEWAITEPDALDLFSMLSYAHRRLDSVS